MDIKRAKQEIKDSIEAYLAKDEFGEYLIPAIRQRPILLMGAPGIGKTQIMEQIARECKVGLVSYTITHHTRQSAVGLPFIKEKTFGQETFSVTEYTMSEIIASVYEKMEKTGLRERCLPIRKHRGAREKRYSFGYAVFLILALMKLLWILPGLQCPYSRCQFPGCGSCPLDRWRHGQRSSRQTHARYMGSIRKFPYTVLQRRETFPHWHFFVPLLRFHHGEQPLHLEADAALSRNR